jgi:hypothetical protein
MMRRIRAGWALTNKSWELLKRHPALLRFPLYAALAALVPLILLALPGLYLIDIGSTVAGVVLPVVGLYLAIFAGYCSASGSRRSRPESGSTPTRAQRDEATHP